MTSNKKIQLAILVLGVILIGYGIFSNRSSDGNVIDSPKWDTVPVVETKTKNLAPKKANPSPVSIKKTESVAEKYRKMCEHTSNSFNCVSFVRNYDADTITVNIPNVHPLIGKEISVRIRGVDAPEMKGSLPCEKNVAIKAKAFVFHKLKNGKIINLTNVSKDKYFRILADVYVDGESISESLIKKGYAYPYFGSKKERLNWCLRN